MRTIEEEIEEVVGWDVMQDIFQGCPIWLYEVMYLCCAVWQPLALCGYGVSNVIEKLNV